MGYASGINAAHNSDRRAGCSVRLPYVLPYVSVGSLKVHTDAVVCTTNIDFLFCLIDSL